MIKPILPFLETMITYNCNLSCHGCTNYSDYNMSGMVPWEKGSDWIRAWRERLDIPDFGIIGGEPLLHPDVSQWIYGVRDLLPKSQIRFTTNGKLVLKKFNVIKQLIEIGNTVVKISVHQPQEFYTQEAVNKLFNYAKWSPITEHGINRWEGPNGTKLQINFPQTFVKTYQGQFDSMLPHNNNPADAFENCVQQQCPLLYEGKIFKCSSIALLKKVTSDWGKDTDPLWQSYLSYHGIDHSCSDESLTSFLSQFGMPETICSMCPSKKDISSFVSHHNTVSTKSQWIKLHHYDKS
jgi:Radical SAM superfamily/4Fe-4S single cluster domain